MIENTANVNPSAILRPAAENIRTIANRATPSGAQPYGWNGLVGSGHTAMMYGGPTENGYRTTSIFRFADDIDCEECSPPSQADLDQMAAWHPDVALAVADLLDAAATTADECARAGEPMPPMVTAALRVASPFAAFGTPSVVVVAG